MIYLQNQKRYTYIQMLIQLIFADMGATEVI